MSEAERAAAIERSQRRARLAEAGRKRHMALDPVTRARLERDYRRAQQQAAAIIRNSADVYA